MSQNNVHVFINYAYVNCDNICFEDENYVITFDFESNALDMKS